MSFCKNSCLLFVCIAFLSQSIFSQKDVIVNPPNNIKSIVLNPFKTNEYAPIIKLGSSFALSFDDLDADQKEYRYKIDHYDYDWKSSGLNSTEFLNGFNDDLIRDFENSFNTLQDYTHYSARLPNDNISILSFFKTSHKFI